MIDPLEELGIVAKKYGVWYHIDAALGGGIILSRYGVPFLSGTGLADSISFNPHKMLGCSLQTSLLLINDKTILETAHLTNAEYLYRNKPYDSSYDPGDGYFLCGRRMDVLKLWIYLMTHDQAQLDKEMSHRFQLKDLLVGLISSDPCFEQVHPNPDLPIVCFRVNIGIRIIGKRRDFIRSEPRVDKTLIGISEPISPVPISLKILWLKKINRSNQNNNGDSSDQNYLPLPRGD